MPRDTVSPRVLALALALCPGIGGRSITRILTRNEFLGRSVREFLRLSPESLVEEYRVPSKGARNWTEGHVGFLERAATIEPRLAELGIRFITGADADYPAVIEQIDPDPPGTLYLYGNARLLQAKCFTVMSSRKAPPAALEAIERAAQEGVLNGEVLVCGHNTPEYQAAAVVPLRFGAPRILVLDRELFDALGDDLRQEPFHSARLWRHEFDPTTDLALTVVHPDQPPHQASNRVRDRLIASLASRLVFPWIGAGGNMEKLARLACKAEREVRIVDLFPGAREWARYGANVTPE